MRLTRVLCFLIILGSSAVATYAQTPVDPIARVNATLDPPCNGATILCLLTTQLTVGPPATYKGALSVAYDPTLNIEFSFDDAAHNIPLTARLTNFQLEYTGVPDLTSFLCQSDIWAICAQSSIGDGPGFQDVFFNFSGAGPCVEGLVVNSCIGFLTAQEGATATNTPIVNPIPEPSSMVLFGTGLILLFVGTKRRIHART